MLLHVLAFEISEYGEGICITRRYLEDNLAVLGTAGSPVAAFHTVPQGTVGTQAADILLGGILGGTMAVGADQRVPEYCSSWRQWHWIGRQHLLW